MKRFVYYVTCFLVCLGSVLLQFNCSKKVEKNDLFLLQWKKSDNNPIIKPGFYGWDSKQILIGTVLKYENKYLMWNYGRETAKAFKIGVFESKDGIQWKRMSNSPVLLPGTKDDWDVTRVSKPCVILTPNGFKMWYVGEKRLADKIIPKIGLAYSEDGISWQKYEKNPIFDLDEYKLEWAFYLRYFWILQENESYKMWFSAVGQDKYQNVESIGYATSEDGLKWMVHPEPVLERDTLSIWEDYYVSNPYVFKINSSYFMFYGGLGRFGYLFKENIGIAQSPDGITWKKYHDNPILIATDHPDAWDREFVTQPRVLPIKENRYFLWYVGADKKNTREYLGNIQIGMAVGQFN